MISVAFSSTQADTQKMYGIRGDNLSIANSNACAKDLFSKGQTYTTKKWE